MAAIILPRKWQQQPVGFLELTIGNEFGIAWAALPGQNVAVPHGISATVTNETFSAGPYGNQAVGTDSAADFNFGSAVLPLYGHVNYSIIALAAPSAENRRSNVYFQGSVAGPAYTQYTLAFNSDVNGADSSGMFGMYEYDNAWIFRSASNSALVDGDWHLFIGARKDTSGALFRDGMDVTASVPTALGNHVSSLPVRIGGSVGQGVTAPVALVAVSTLALDSFSAKALKENPWQIFRPRRQVFYSFAAAGTPTLSVPQAIVIGQTTAQPQVTLTF